jgi:hypothetical protein
VALNAGSAFRREPDHRLRSTAFEPFLDVDQLVLLELLQVRRQVAARKADQRLQEHKIARAAGG